MNQAGRECHGAVQRLEYELIVRDFTAVVNAGHADEARTFLHPDVVFRAGPKNALVGSENLIKMLNDIRAHFETFTVTITRLAVSDTGVLVEQLLLLKLAGRECCSLPSFSSFRFERFQIAEWRLAH